LSAGGARSLAVPRSRQILILGGTTEARALADALTAMGHAVTTSLAGRTAEPRRPQGEMRTGGFGGAAGLADYLRVAGIEAVIDATHPYAAAISARAIEASAAAGRPLLRFERAPWQPQKGDRWIIADSLPDAAKVAPELGRRAFLTIGVKELDSFRGTGDVWFLVRLVDRPPAPIPLSEHELILARGPFAVADERALMQRYGIDLVIAKNSGGDSTYGKVAAARDLGLPLLLLRRPVLPPAETAMAVPAVIAWVDEL
jgi:precorrin-6A/cobalt-precorrin-6A reductase